MIINVMNINGPVTSGPAQKSKSAKKSARTIDYMQHVTVKYAAEKRAKLIDMDMEKREIEKDQFEREVARHKLEKIRKTLQLPE
uniref:Uncharacterized protein n=1 Tax=Panagrolaimus davidi TaxID=227884 RepID=A0A914PE38_9BILA